ncbi:hypothetical protein BU14_0577s0006 [Porphyra umbilicalis]|uniref:DUF5060 domain-containing protein n=1 Tax=Porphyra umbilicalis TaxID=2786 RepID=A0A1X6NRU0_PORUM|nr:hypothetical protein BU14_0577s0006 [Porphyra umbilicalis]|eukprot:OSX71206.1 hypothetical protein BU14_0577s0006 [Porphyra umbilicalis]
MGSVDVGGTDKGYPDFRRRGKLVYSSSRYMRTQGSKEVFLRVGPNSPENILGYNEFDNTPTALHRFPSHRKDWRSWSPTWGRRDKPRGKSIIGAINYLASVNMNSIYVLLLTHKGDSRDVWPFTSATERYRMDVSKLAQWEVLFEHMNSRGIVLHALFSETENESLFEHDENGKTGGFANSRRLYHREMVSRFGHHPGLLFNIGEETGWDDMGGWGPRRGLTDWQRKEFASEVARLDSYDTPMLAHTFPDDHDKVYRPMLGNRHFDGASLQLTSSVNSHRVASNWLARSRAGGRVWSVSVDEVGSGGVKPDAADWSRDRPRKELLWGTLMAGGSGVEIYSATKDQTLEDFRTYDRMWRQMHHAVYFFHHYRVPFWRMDSRDELSNRRRSSWVLATSAGDAYVMFLRNGDKGRSLDLRGQDGGYMVRWYDPRKGGPLRTGSVGGVPGGGWRFLGSPPWDKRRDWVALIARWGSGIGGA